MSLAIQSHHAEALADGHVGASAEREAWIRTYRITTNSGDPRSREQVIKTVANELRRCRVKGPTAVAKTFVDDDAWLSRRTGETAGSIARGVADAVVALWGTV